MKFALAPGLDIYEIENGLYVSGQIGPDSIPLLAQKGIRAIVCNRFDGEEPGQPTFMSVDWAATGFGMRAIYLPVLAPPRPVSDAEAFDFAKALEMMHGPVLAYCRTGKRPVTLWALNEARRRPFKEILLVAGGAGHDLTGFVQRFQRLHGVRW